MGIRWKTVVPLWGTVVPLCDQSILRADDRFLSPRCEAPSIATSYVMDSVGIRRLTPVG
jgi:hypothetical protein